MLSEKQAEDAWKLAHSLRPKRTSWGFFSMLGAKAGEPDGCARGFTWFVNQEQMLGFLRDVMPWSIRVEEHRKREISCYALECGMRYALLPVGSKISIEQMRERLNMHYVGHLQMEWMGSLEDLLESGHRHALYVRGSFHTGRSETCRREIRQDMMLEHLEFYGRPIKPKERKAFVDFLRTWGR
jgi:hypothetical protein